MRCRHRLSKLLLRQGLVYSGGAAWTAAHDVWLRGQNFDQPALQAAFDSDYEAMILTLARRDRLDAAIADMAADSPYTPMVRRLGCLRPNAVSVDTPRRSRALAVEIGDWHREKASPAASTRPRRQPPTPPQMGTVHRPQKASGGCKCRRRVRARRVVPGPSPRSTTDSQFPHDLVDEASVARPAA